MIVVDASIAAAWLVNDAASEFAARLLLMGEELVAPDILYPEVGNVVWKRIIRGETPVEFADQLLIGLGAIGLTIVTSVSLLGRALRLAVEIKHPVYDCLYIELARQRAASLATADRRMAAAAARLDPPLPLWRE